VLDESVTQCDDTLVQGRVELRAVNVHQRSHMHARQRRDLERELVVLLGQLYEGEG
jgi:hypothetical protein